MWWLCAFISAERIARSGRFGPTARAGVAESAHPSAGRPPPFASPPAVREHAGCLRPLPGESVFSQTLCYVNRRVLLWLYLYSLTADGIDHLLLC